MKCDHSKHVLVWFAYNLKILHMIIGMSDGQDLEHFKDAFPPNIEAQLLQIGDMDTEIGHA